MKTNNKSPKPDLVAAEIRPGQSLELLKELHILTREGKLNQDSRRKLKQVYHLYGFIEKLLLELPVTDKGLTLADHGAGKSYLGFIIYDLFFNAANTKRLGHIYGIETRAELVQKSRELATRLGFKGMSFLNLSVEESAQSADLTRKSTSSPPCTPATPPQMTPSPSACKSAPNTWFWSPAAKPKWPLDCEITEA